MEVEGGWNFVVHRLMDLLAGLGEGGGGGV